MTIRLVDIDSKVADTQRLFSNLNQLPVDISPILKRLDIKVQKGRFSDRRVGAMFSKKDSIIYISAEESYLRNNFYITNILSRYFLDSLDNDIFLTRDHFKKMNEFRVSTSIKDLHNDQDFCADYFAVSLLMPEAETKKYFRLTNSLESLAAIFGVPKEVAKFKVNLLGGLR